LLTRALLMTGTMPFTSESRVPAMEAPIVPPMTRIIDVGDIRVAGLPPSMTMEPMMATRATTIPTGVARSDMALVPPVFGPDQAQVRPTGPAAEVVGGRHDRRPEHPDPVDDGVHRLGHDQFRAVDEGHDAVRSRLDALDQIGVDRQPVSVEPRDEDHRRPFHG